MTSSQAEPLLNSTHEGAVVTYGHGDGKYEEWSKQRIQQWAEWAQFVVPPAGDGPITASGHEIRQAAAQDPYPQWIYAALVTPENSGDVTVGGGNVPPVKPVVDALTPSERQCVQGLDEDQIRLLLTEHVDGKCCWGRKSAHEWDIKKVEDCNAYIGTLETFIEERELVEEMEPFTGGPYAGQEYDRESGAWEIDMRDEFPLLFTTLKEARKKIPSSQRVENCGHCSGRGEVLCPPCHADAQPGVFRPGMTTKCTGCHGRGLIAHHDGSDTNCGRCHGRGSLQCMACNSRGLVKCDKCSGYGALLFSKTVIVRWRTLVNKKVSASSYAASVPDDVFHEADSVQLYADQSHQCKPVQFPNSYGLSKLSTDLFTFRTQIPPPARVICERHQLRMVPVTRVVMAEGENSFEFFIVGLGKEIYMDRYPQECHCGLCCCLQMCTIS